MVTWESIREKVEQDMRFYLHCEMDRKIGKWYAMDGSGQNEGRMHYEYATFFDRETNQERFLVKIKGTPTYPDEIAIYELKNEVLGL